jgi:hypothetical protein
VVVTAGELAHATTNTNGKTLNDALSSYATRTAVSVLRPPVNAKSRLNGSYDEPEALLVHGEGPINRGSIGVSSVSMSWGPICSRYKRGS